MLLVVHGYRAIAAVLTLGLCVIATGATGAGQDAPKQEPAKAAALPIRFDRNVVFTLGMSNEPSTNAKIATALARRLRENGKTGAGPVRSAWIVPEGGWGVADYVQQCANDPNTLGAFIVLPPSSANSTENYIALLRSSTEVTLSMLVAECRHDGTNAAGVLGSTTIVWASDTEQGMTGRTQIEFFPLAVLTSVYLAFAPQRTTQTTTTAVFPVPTPIPAGGARSSVQTQNSTVLNASGSASLQGNVLNAFSGTGLGATIGAQASADRQTLRAADDALGHLLANELDDYCKRRVQPSAVIASPVVDHDAFCGW